MKAYVSFLKVMGILLLIPIVLVLVVALGLIGFGVDFKNAQGNEGSGTIYMLVLPLVLIAAAGWVIYSLSKRHHAREAQRQETEIRQQARREQALGTDTREIIVNALAQQGSKTAAELSQLLGTSQEQTHETIKKLLQAGEIRQDTSQDPSRYYAVPQSNDDEPS
jgi:hypothetical protein